MLTLLLGPGNVSNVPLEMFGNRFQLTPTLGKLANIAAEVGEIDKVAEGYLKSFTAGDRMIFERKYHDPIEAYPTARLVLATNNRPRFADRSAGLWRRMLLMPFRIQIPPGKQDKKLLDKLKPELPGIFLWALEGLRRLRANGGFTVPAICQEAVEEYKSESNPARTFLEQFYAEGITPTQPLLCPNVYAFYSAWVKAHGYKALGEAAFGKEVYKRFPNVKRARENNGKRRYYYANLTLQDGYTPEQQLEDAARNLVATIEASQIRAVEAS